MRTLVLGVLFALFTGVAFAQTTDLNKPQIHITDGSINAGDMVSWTNDNVYVLDGYVYVEEGAELTIEAGTVIKGIQQPSTSDIASVLVIARGGKLFAEGTATMPIVFTTEYDSVALADNDPNDGVDYTLDRGLWGGVVLLGKSTLNIASEAVVEGLPDDEPLHRSWYGGNDDADNSGTLRYISIRYTGITVEANKELQGLTLGCVGSGTTIEYIESFNSSDDGYEFFGSTVNTKYLVSAFNSDDSFDYDQGFRGTGQFWFAIQSPELGNRAGEYDSGDKGALTAEPKSNPQLYNCTYIGSGASSANTDNDLVLTYKEYGGGGHYNSIFTDFRGKAVKVEDLGGADSRERLDAGELKLENNIWFKEAGLTLNDIVDQDFMQTYLAANNNSVVDPQLRAVGRGQGELDPRPVSGGAAYTTPRADYPSDGFLTPVSYMGAFGSGNWLAGWTALDQNGIIGEVNTGGDVFVKDGDINAGDKVTWTKDNTYFLDGFVYVEDGAELTIEAGTVIKGLQQPSTGDIASALIITRGAKIFANGTANEPIIFTSEYDDVNLKDDDPNDGVDWTIDRGLWAGVVLLGKSTLNIASEAVVEGLPDDEPQRRSWYGGNDDADNSGVMRYVSIRYTGITVEANKELQGLTLGCVGSGTTIEYIESFNSSDDGYEFFGGTVNTKYMVSAFNSDDSYDYDQGFRGKGQFWFVIQSPELGNRAGEYDSGDKGALTASPKSNPQLYNCTYIGSGASSANTDNDLVLTYKEYAGGGHYNSIFTDFRGNAVKIEDLGGADSRERLDAGELRLENNIWWKEDDVDLNDMVDQDFVRTYLAANNNYVVNPSLRGISRTTDGQLDPRPHIGAHPFFQQRADYPAGDAFYTPVNYIGAFGDDNWLMGWTALSQNGIAGELTATSVDPAGPATADFTLNQNYPNPFNPTTTISFSVPSNNDVKIEIFNALGAKVATVVNGNFNAGTYNVTFNATGLPSGMYMYRLTSGSSMLTKSMLLSK